MDNKEKVLIGVISFIAGATVGFLLAPIKSKLCFESFSCSKFDDLENGDILKDVEESETNDVSKEESIEE